MLSSSTSGRQQPVELHQLRHLYLNLAQVGPVLQRQPRRWRRLRLPPQQFAHPVVMVAVMAQRLVQSSGHCLLRITLAQPQNLDEGRRPLPFGQLLA